jgi:cation diffusion facilitator family transporter
MAGSTAHIYQALVSNLAIAIAKAGAAWFTGSGAMLAEAIHTSSDCVNQVLLLFGLRQAARPPTPAHPFGYGRNVYFWSFMVALLLFTGGGVFSIYEGVHKLEHPEAVENVAIGLTILVFSLAVEGWVTLANIKELRTRADGTPFFRFLRETKDSDLVVIFGENAAATLGLSLALLAFVATALTGDGRFDGAGSVAIGLVLVGVAVFLAIEVKSLLVGESADPAITRAAERIADEHPQIRRLVKAMTVQQGPGEVIVACKIHLEPSLTVPDVYRAIQEFEDQLRASCPEVRWCFTEPGDRRDDER